MLACCNPPILPPTCRKTPGRCTLLVQKTIIRASSGDEILVCRMPRFVGIFLRVTRKFSTGRINLKYLAMPVLDRYIVIELIPPMVLGIAVFSTLGVCMSIGPELGELVGRAGVTWSTLLLAMRLVLFRVPAYIGFSLPIASLLASLLTFGRMGADNEIVAMKSCGLNAWRIVQPAVLMFTGLTALHLFLSESVIPLTNKKAQGLKSDTVYLQHKVTPQDEDCIRNGNLRHLFYAHRYNDKELLNVTLVEMQEPDPDGDCGKSTTLDLDFQEGRNGLRLRKVLTAESATWDARSQFWMFRNGAEYVVGTSNPSKGKPVKLPDDRSTKPLHPAGASYALLCVCRFNARYCDGLTAAPLELAKLQHGRNFDELTLTEVVRLQQLLDESRNIAESRKIKVKLQQRLALPFACIVFGTLGSFISLSLPREHKKVGFGWMLAIVFSYYVMNVGGSVLGQLNVVSPFLGAWLPNLVGVSAVFVLMKKAEF